MTEKVRSEDVLGLKWDRCATDLIVKSCGGLILGGTFSALFFKSKLWPITLGVGMGIGMAYSNCQNDVQNPGYSKSS